MISLSALLALASPASADSLELVLNDPAGRTAPLDKCDVRLCSSLVELIDRAESTLDMAFYGFRSQSAIFEAAKRAKERGVRVRVVVDKDADGKNYYTSTPLWEETFEVHDDLATDLATKAALKPFNGQARCPRPEGFVGPLQCVAFDLGDRCYLANQASREEITFKGHIMHNKFAIVDGRHVWMGSSNASDSGTGGYNANLVVTLDSPTVASWYAAEFETMYTHGKYHNDKEAAGPRSTWIVPNEIHVEGHFSPQDRPITNAVRTLIQKARSRIDVAVFFLTHKRLAQDLIDAKKRGVKVRVTLDATAAKNGYSKHEVLRAAGIPLKIENWGGKMHAKSAVIDGRILVTGSMNWTSAGEYDNDENTLIIRSQKHAAQYEAWFDKMWSDLPDQWLEGRPDPESQDSTTACHDGVDNDFDHLADAEDPGCGPNPPPLPALPVGTIVEKKYASAKCSWNMVEQE